MQNITILKYSRYNKSYADTVSNSNVKGDNGLYYSYNSVFSEYTTKSQGIACSDYANCYIGCTCRDNWNKRSASASEAIDGGSLKTAGAKAVSTAGTKANVSTMSEGDTCTVSVTDPRYGVPCSITTTKDCAGVCDGSAYFRCTSGSTSSYCPSGQYSVYLGKQQCSSGSATNSTSCYTCYNCTYSCPSGYSTSSYCSSGYYAVSTTKSKDQNVSTCPASTDKCYKCVAMTCDDYDLYSSSQSGMHCSSVSKDPGLTCYSCHTPNYTWCPSGSQIGSCGSGYYVSDTKPKECTGCSATSGTCNVCSQCTYSCPSGYSTSVSCGSGYEKESTYKEKDQTSSNCSASTELCYRCVEVSVNYYTTVEASGQGNDLILVIEASGAVGKSYTVSYDGDANLSGNRTDGVEGKCSMGMRLIGSCTLSAGSSSTSCIMYQAACENISWSGSLTLE